MSVELLSWDEYRGLDIGKSQYGCELARNVLIHPRIICVCKGVHMREARETHKFYASLCLDEKKGGRIAFHSKRTGIPCGGGVR